MFWKGVGRLFPQGAVFPEGAFQHLQFASSRVELAVRFLSAAVLLFAMPNTRQIADGIEGACAAHRRSRIYQYAIPSLAGLLLVAALSQMQKASAFLYFQF